MLSDAEVDVGYLQVFIMTSKFYCSKNETKFNPKLYC